MFEIDFVFENWEDSVFMEHVFFMSCCCCYHPKRCKLTLKGEMDEGGVVIWYPWRGMVLIWRRVLVWKQETCEVEISVINMRRILCQDWLLDMESWSAGHFLIHVFLVTSSFLLSIGYYMFSFSLFLSFSSLSFHLSSSYLFHNYFHPLGSRNGHHV